MTNTYWIHPTVAALPSVFTADGHHHGARRPITDDQRKAKNKAKKQAKASKKRNR